MKKSLLFIIEHLNAGGAERSLVDILTHLNYSKYDVDLLLLQGKGDYEKEIPSEVNILLYSLNDAFGPMKTCLKNAKRNRDWFSFWFRLVYFFSSHTSWKNLRFTRNLFNKAKKSYDCVIACRQSFICNEMTAFVFKSNKKLSWWHHGDLEMNQNDINRLKSAYNFMDKIIAVSNSSADIVKKGFDLDDNKIGIISNMICSERIISNARKMRMKKPDKCVITSVGRLSQEKNVLLCVEIGVVLKRKGFDFLWYIVGDGDEKQDIEKKIQDNNLQNHFVLTGRLDNPYPYFDMADIFVHPSLVESQGIAILESMVLVTPVIVVNSEGPNEYIVNGENGYLVENDANEISDIIIQLYNNEPLRKQLALNAKTTIRQFLPEPIIQKVESVIDD